ncbi:hypothetical protein FB451DRAFT_1391487 [Mycena latifolia]|nr:hypothetical protein FB451DRAFT_1391487 [Mycena latifolia]
MTKDVSEKLGVPVLPQALAGLLLLVDTIQKTAQNSEDIEGLAQRLQNLTDILAKAPNENGSLSAGILDRVAKLSKFVAVSPLLATLVQVSDEVRACASRGLIKRALSADKDGEWMSGQIQTVSWAIESFTVGTLMNIEFALDDHSRFVKDATHTMQASLGNISIAVEDLGTRLSPKEGVAHHAVKAAFNAKIRENCAKDTRTDILAGIFRWIDADSEPDNAEDRCIFWLNGSAGTGKTTIASTVAKRCSEDKPDLLGASFFCSRDDAECSNLRLIFTTISYQLGLFNLLFREHVSLVLQANPDISYASVPFQLQELIVKPLQSVRDSFPRCIVILDALDECKDTGTTSTILSALSLHITELSPLRFFVTSRPESHIRIGFSSRELQPNTQELVLHQVALDTVEQDIHHYLVSQLALTKSRYHIEGVWPPSDDVHTLVQRSAGLFIFAATAIKFIEDRAYSNPRDQLVRLVHETGGEVEKSSPLHALDQLYNQVLRLAFPDISTRLLRLLKTVLGSIIHIRDLLCIFALENLLDLAPGQIRETLWDLHSVIIVPDDSLEVIRLLHPSFFDFITNSDRCARPEFVVKFEEQHTLLALCCLQAMTGLTRDICQVGDPSRLNTEVPDIPARIAMHIPPHVQYACRHWAYHFTQGMLSDDVLGLLNQFCSQHLLHWIEVCSIVGDLRIVLTSVADVIRKLSTAGKNDIPSMQLLRDCEHFTRQFFAVISTRTLQVYRSALLFTPMKTALKKVYSGSLDVAVKISGLRDNWNTCIRTIEGHRAEVFLIAYSPDGARLLSGSSDHTLRLWDATSGAHLHTFSGPPWGLTAVAFSPDSSRIAAGSKRSAVRVWNVATGECIAHLSDFYGTKGGIFSIAFWPDSNHIAAAVEHRTVRVFDLATETCTWSLDTARDEPMTAVAFSPDGTHVATAHQNPSNGNPIQIWDRTTSNESQTGDLRNYRSQVDYLAFSPDGTQIFGGARKGRKIRRWEAKSGTLLQALVRRAEDSEREVLAISLDGTRIASAYYL